MGDLIRIGRGEDEEVVSVDDLREEVKRDKHDQKPLELRIQEFEEVQFVAFLNDLHAKPKGDIYVSLLVPYRYRTFATPLLDAYGVPLSIDIQRWAKFDAFRRNRDA